MTITKNKRLVSNGSSSNADLSQFLFGKVQPQSVELEEAILGALMLDKKAASVICSILKPHHFYLVSHQEIYKVILDLYSRTEPIDCLTVMEGCKKNGTLDSTGGAAYLAKLTAQVASGANIEYHSRIVIQKWMLREQIILGTNMVRDAFEDTSDPFDLLDRAGRGLDKISGAKNNANNQTANQVGVDLLKKCYDIFNSTGKTIGTPFFYDMPKFNSITQGGCPNDLIVVSGDSGSGKSTLFNNIIIGCAETDTPVWTLSGEMQNTDQLLRAVSTRADVNGLRIRAGRFYADGADQEYDNIKEAINYYASKPIHFGFGKMTYQDLVSNIYFYYRTKGVRTFLIDRLELLDLRSLAKEKIDRIESVMALLRSLVNELGITIVLAVQVGKSVRKNAGCRPTMGDLLGSSAIYQNATKIILTYRPEMYNIFFDKEGNNLRGKGELHLVKNTHGPCGIVKMNFAATRTIWREPQDLVIDFGEKSEEDDKEEEAAF